MEPFWTFIISAMTTMLTAVIGAVGPDICVAVPPNKAAKKLKKWHRTIQRLVPSQN